MEELYRTKDGTEVVVVGWREGRFGTAACVRNELLGTWYVLARDLVRVCDLCDDSATTFLPRREPPFVTMALCEACYTDVTEDADAEARQLNPHAYNGVHPDEF